MHVFVRSHKDRPAVGGWPRGKNSSGRVDANHVVVAIVLALLMVVVGGARAETQNDWAGGPTSGANASSWGDSFAASENVAWLANSGRLSLSGVIEASTEQIVDDQFPAPAGLITSDVDQDGALDFVAASIDGDEVAWWRNDGSGEWQKRTIDDEVLSAFSVAVSDIDGDGDVDVLAASFESDRIDWWENLDGAGEEWRRHLIGDEFDAAHWVDVADLDGDGDVDVLGAAARGNLVTVWLNSGSTPVVWTEHVVEAGYGGARTLVPGDVDGDGDLDVIGVALDDDMVTWWSNNGGAPSTWPRSDISQDFNAAHHLVVSDLDQDGDLDVVAAGFSELRIGWFRNDGGDPIEWTQFDFGTIVTGGLVVDVTDLDGDNRLDVVASSERFSSVYAWRSVDIESNTWEEINVVSLFLGAWPVHTGDIDGNGSQDVAAGAGGGSEVAWWNVSSFVADGWLESSVLVMEDGVDHLFAEVEVDLPTGTDLVVEIRASSDEDDLGPWFETRPGRSDAVFVSGPAFVQYRLAMTTTDPAWSPVVHSVELRAVDGPVVPGPRRGGGRQAP